MSETPRTDAAIFKMLSSLQSGTMDVVHADLCRTLERELAEANRAREEAVATLEKQGICSSGCDLQTAVNWAVRLLDLAGNLETDIREKSGYNAYWNEQKQHGHGWTLVGYLSHQRKRAEQAETQVKEYAQGIVDLSKTMRYLVGVAERGEGRFILPDETPEAFVLGYVKRIEARVKELEQTVCDIRGQRDHQNNNLMALRAEVSNLRDQLAAAQKDAERYLEVLDKARGWIAGRTEEFSAPNFTDRYGYANSGMKLLAAIDAAREGK